MPLWFCKTYEHKILLLLVYIYITHINIHTLYTYHTHLIILNEFRVKSYFISRRDRENISFHDHSEK